LLAPAVEEIANKLSSFRESLSHSDRPLVIMQEQTTPREIDVSDYADHPEWWSPNTIWIDSNGHVDGQAVIFDSENNIDVTASVYSYDYNRGGESRTNHVPHIVVSDMDGSIQHEPDAYDSRNPQTAIKRAIQTAEWAYKEYRD